jgi:hypothetical protein
MKVLLKNKKKIAGAGLESADLALLAQRFNQLSLLFVNSD